MKLKKKKLNLGKYSKEYILSLMIEIQLKDQDCLVSSTDIVKKLYEMNSIKATYDETIKDSREIDKLINPLVRLEFVIVRSAGYQVTKEAMNYILEFKHNILLNEIVLTKKRLSYVHMFTVILLLLTIATIIFKW